MCSFSPSKKIIEICFENVVLLRRTSRPRKKWLGAKENQHFQEPESRSSKCLTGVQNLYHFHANALKIIKFWLPVSSGFEVISQRQNNKNSITPSHFSRCRKSPLNYLIKIKVIPVILSFSSFSINWINRVCCCCVNLWSNCIAPIKSWSKFQFIF